VCKPAPSCHVVLIDSLMFSSKNEGLSFTLTILFDSIIYLWYLYVCRYVIKPPETNS